MGLYRLQVWQAHSDCDVTALRADIPFRDYRRCGKWSRYVIARNNYCEINIQKQLTDLCNQNYKSIDRSLEVNNNVPFFTVTSRQKPVYPFICYYSAK
ncbi:unnamed protein product [Colias eurytheme]|nr:unnamed protein product [Colias eurytheme]